ncbi:hypothetical protein LT17_06967 [Pseudomonas aeruginosa]|nr:hypothetical protein LT17_06967 [Pseudomonas aeruginosa]
MPEKQRTNQGDYDELLDQLVTEVFYGTIDQLAAIIGGNDLHPRGQALAQFVKLGLDRGDGLASILAAAQDHNAADYLALAVEFGDAATHFRAELDMRNLAKRHRHAATVQAQGDGAKVIQRLQVTRSAHHELGLGQFQHRTAGFLVGPGNCLSDLLLGDAAAGQLDRIEHHLVLLDHATDGGHLGDIGQGLQFELEEPVL